MSRHDEMKERIERGTGDKFIDWYNHKHDRRLKYVGRPGQAPDLIYSDGKKTVILEVTTAWYSQQHADFSMRNIRRIPDTPNNFTFAGDMEKALAQEISKQICEKCRKDYGENCALIVRVGSDALTTPWEMREQVIPQIRIPTRNPFRSIYVMNRMGDEIWEIS